MTQRFTRRRVLATTGLSLVTAVAGCSQSDGGATGETPTESTPVDTETQAASETTTGGASNDESATPDPPEPSEPTTVSFETETGSTVDATRYGAGDCGIVLVPQINLDRESWRPQANRLAGDGRIALAIDEGDERVAAVLAAIDYLRREHSVEQIVLLGASTGGEAVVGAAAQADPLVDGLVTLSAAGGQSHASDLTGEKLFVVSEGDEERFVRTARELHDGALEPKELKLFSGSAHGQRLFESDHSDELWSAITSLVERVCGE